jgi:hypothetical protein
VRKLPLVFALSLLFAAAAPVVKAQSQSDDTNGDVIERDSRFSHNVRSGQAASLLFFINPDLCPDTANPCFGYKPAFKAGKNIGRWVPLNGDIDGLNFEPGQCSTEPFLGWGFPVYCLFFGDGVAPGTFKRARQGDTAFTTCNCTVGGKGDPLIPDFPLQIVGEAARTSALLAYDKLQRQIENRKVESYFTLRIQYFDPGVNPNYPAGYTEFDMFAGRERLHGLVGTGVLDFNADVFPPITFMYKLRGRP